MFRVGGLSFGSTTGYILFMVKFSLIGRVRVWIFQRYRNGSKECCLLWVDVYGFNKINLSPNVSPLESKQVQLIMALSSEITIIIIIIIIGINRYGHCVLEFGVYLVWLLSASVNKFPMINERTLNFPEKLFLRILQRPPKWSGCSYCNPLKGSTTFD